MGLFFNYDSPTGEFSRKESRAEKLQGLMQGYDKVTTEGTMKSFSYDESGNEVENYMQPPAAPMITREGGYMSSQKTPEDLAMLAGGLASANFTPVEQRTILQPMMDERSAYADLMRSQMDANNGKDERKMQMDIEKDFRKEERATASQGVKSFDKQVKQMQTSYGQLQGLANQAAGGDRGARNAMIVTLSRLISPGIVTEAEARGLSGGQDIMKYVLERATSGSANLDNLLKGLDPYGEGFDSNALLKIGDSVVNSGKQPLINMYEGFRARAQTSEMSDLAFNTNFKNNTGYDFLKSFTEKTNGNDKAPDDDYQLRMEKALGKK